MLLLNHTALNGYIPCHYKHPCSFLYSWSQIWFTKWHYKMWNSEIEQKARIHQQQINPLPGLCLLPLCGTTLQTRLFPIIDPRPLSRGERFTVAWTPPLAASLYQHDATHFLVSTLISDHIFIISRIVQLSELGRMCCCFKMLWMLCIITELNTEVCVNEKFLCVEIYFFVGLTVEC